MKCNRCGKENPAEIHTCTAPLAIALAETLERQFPEGTAHSFLDGEAAAELRRLHAENEALRQQLKQQDPSAGGIIFAVEQAIKNGDCHWEIESAFDDYESERIALARAGEVK